MDLELLLLPDRYFGRLVRSLFKGTYDGESRVGYSFRTGLYE